MSGPFPQKNTPHVEFFNSMLGTLETSRVLSIVSEGSETQEKHGNCSAWRPGPQFDSATKSLCGPGHVAFPLWAPGPVFSPLQVEDRIICRFLLTLRFCVSAR